jgi:hypothetical protein
MGTVMYLEVICQLIGRERADAASHNPIHIQI